MLVGLATAVIPLAIHLLHRGRTRPLPFSNLEFLRRLHHSRMRRVRRTALRHEEGLHAKRGRRAAAVHAPLVGGGDLTYPPELPRAMSAAGPSALAAQLGCWDPDSDECYGCQEEFTLFRRRHHCRNCGKLLCKDCSAERRVLAHIDQGSKPQRVCNG